MTDAKRPFSINPHPQPLTTPQAQPQATTQLPEQTLEDNQLRDAQDRPISPEAYLHLKQSVRHFRDQQVGQAEVEMIKAIDIHPPLSPLYNVFGILKIIRRAINTLKQSVYNALTTDPQFMDEFVKEGIQLLAENRLDEAEARFQKALALNPNNTDARFRLGFTHVSQKKYRDAVAIFEELILMDPQNINAFFMLGLTYSELREYYPCISNLQHALRMQPAFVEARLTLADAYHHQGKYLISLRELDALQQFIPDEDTTYLHRGMILLEMDRKDEAIPYFEKVTEIKPNVMEAYELLVALYEDQGLFDKGIEMAQKALLMAPERLDMQAAVQRLEAKKAKLEAASAPEA